MYAKCKCNKSAIIRDDVAFINVKQDQLIYDLIAIEATVSEVNISSESPIKNKIPKHLFEE